MKTLFTILMKTIIIVIISEFISQTMYAQIPLSFNGDKTKGCVPLTVQFSHSNTSVSSIQWSFGDGSTSILNNPTHVYTIQGKYAVKMLVIFQNGKRDSVIENDYIIVLQNPVIDFSADKNSICINEEIQFSSNGNTIADWTWDFGDGMISTLPNPVHLFQTPGSYDITLLGSNQFGCSVSKQKKNLIEVKSKPLVEFTSQKQVFCTPGEELVFTSQKNGIQSWRWQFGDGSNSSLPDPSKKYNLSGFFTVQLSVTGQNGCTDSITKNNYIQIKSAIPVIINADIIRACEPLTVSFTSSVDTLFNCNWDFGDGTTSNEQRPAHTYSLTGHYHVTLNVTSPDACIYSGVMDSLITVNPRTFTEFTFVSSGNCLPVSVQFNTSQVTNCQFHWDFGDGNISNDQNPQHTYISEGDYSVKLSVTNEYGCKTELVKNNVFTFHSPQIQFTSDYNGGCAPVTIHFTETTVGALSWLWDFGDGATSIQQNPYHTYSSIGVYAVSLAVTDTEGCTFVKSISQFIKVENSFGQQQNPVTIKGCIPFRAEFQDDTPGAYQWLWDFGDSTTSADQNPIHEYIQHGNFTVSLIAQIAGGCVKEITNYVQYDLASVKADFTLIKNSECPPYTVTFQNNSVNSTDWIWSFGDSTLSTLQNPIHVYAEAGTYSIIMQATSPERCTQTIESFQAVSFEPLSAEYSMEIKGGSFPLGVQFTPAMLNATSWHWDFGDGTYSEQSSPYHIYYTSAIYQPILTIVNSKACTTTFSMILKLDTDPVGSVFGYLNSNFTTEDSTNYITGCAPKVVHFKNLSTGAVKWFWLFGDGQNSIVDNPVYTYYWPGQYDVTLISENISGVKDTFIINNLVRINGPSSDFTHKIKTLCESQSVQFNSLAVPDVSSYLVSHKWDFGDGQFSNQINPMHTYSTPGDYMVTYFVTDNNGCNSNISKELNAGFTQALRLDSPREGCVPFEARFHINIRNIKSFFWDFGDGHTSSQSHPTHIYKSSGIYSLSVTVQDSTDCEKTFILDTLIRVYSPKAHFRILENSFCNSVKIKLTNESKNTSLNQWDFGDGVTSNDFDPAHEYLTSGNYTISLIASDHFCSDTFTVQLPIVLSPVKADFETEIIESCFPIEVKVTNNSSDSCVYTWKNDGLVLSSAYEPVFIFEEPGLKTIQLEVTDTSGCMDTLTKSLFLEKTIRSDFSSNVRYGCKFLDVKFQDSSSNAIEWNWDFGDGNYSKEQNPYHAYNSKGNYTIKLLVKSSIGCADSLQMSNYVVVNAPKAYFTSSLNNSCPPALFDFFNLSDGADIFEWNFGDGKKSSMEKPSHIYYEPGWYDVELIVKDTMGCTDTLTKNEYIHVAGPVVSFETDHLFSCSPDTFRFINTSKDANVFYWNFGDGYSDTSSNTEHYFETKGYYPIILIAVDTLLHCSRYYQDTVEISPLTGINFDAITGCEYEPVKFVNLTDTVINTFVDCKWVFGDGFYSNAWSPSHFFSGEGEYKVLLEVENDKHCHQEFEKTIKVLTNPKAVFEIEEEIFYQKNETFQPVNKSQNAVSYLWSFNGRYSSKSDPIFSITDTGSHTIKLIAYNELGCCDTTEHTVRVKPASSVFVPNAFTPNGDGLNDDFFVNGVEYLSDYTIKIFNRWGKKIFESTEFSTNWDGTMDGKPVPQGAYTYLISFEDFKNINRILSGSITVLR